MGYELHITRQNDWLDENDSQKISLEEWKALLANDSEMRLDGFAEATTTAGVTLRIEEEGIAVWTKYSKDGLDGNHAWFHFSKGNIEVKNPDDEIVAKMIDIAGKLQAKVQGDDGEFYELSTNNQIVTKEFMGNNNKPNKQRPWWKFW
jgi:hypothetical protein